MPLRVPRVTAPQEPQAQRAASPVPLPDQVGKPAAAGAEAMQNTAAMLTEQAKKARDDEIEMLVDEADIKKAQLDGAAVNEFLSLQGQEARERHPEFLERIRRNSEDVRGQIKDREVLKNLTRIDGYRSLRSTQQLDAHFRTEQLAYQAQLHESRRDLFIQDWASAAADDDHEAQRLRGGSQGESGYHGEIRKLGKLTGADPATIELALREADTLAVRAAVAGRVAGRDLKGARKLLEKHGKGIDPGVLAGLQANVAAGEAEESAFVLADEIAAGSGDLATQVRSAHEDWSSGKITFEVYDRAARELRFRHDEARQRRALDGNAALDAAKTSSQLQGGRPPDAATMKQLDELGVGDDYRLWSLKGGQLVTTLFGHEYLNNVTDKELLRHREFATLQHERRLEIGVADMPELQSKWEQAWARAGKPPSGSGAGGGAPPRLTTRETAVDFWRQKSNLFDEGDIEEKQNWRIGTFVTEVDRRLAASGRKDYDQAVLDQVVRETWNNGGVVNGHWRPFVSMTRAEKAEATSYFTPGMEPGQQGPPANEVRMVTPEDFDEGGAFADKRGELGHPNWAALDAMDTDTDSIRDGIMRLGLGKVSIGGKSYFDPGTDEELERTYSTVPDVATTWKILASQDVTPTAAAIQAYRAGKLAALEQENRLASRRVDAAVEIRRARFRETFREEWLMLAQEMREGETFAQRAYFNVAEHGTDPVPDWRTPDELDRDAFFALRAKYAKELKGYKLIGEGGLASRVFPETDPMWRYLQAGPQPKVEAPVVGQLRSPEVELTERLIEAKKKERERKASSKGGGK